jgi:hypothetical protein
MREEAFPSVWQRLDPTTADRATSGSCRPINRSPPSSSAEVSSLCDTVLRFERRRLSSRHVRLIASSERARTHLDLGDVRLLPELGIQRA